VIGIVPNPAKDEVTLSFGALAGKQGMLTVYNEMGNIIYQLNSDAISNSLEINTSNWIPGIYEIRFITSSAIYKGKLAVINK
jgi:polyhydroxybutyrate depolymerase